MIDATVKVKGISPYSQSKPVTASKKGNEKADEFEKRTWRERIHSNGNGTVVIPPMAFKNALVDAAIYLGIKIPGQGNKKYAKKFESAVLVVDPAHLDIPVEDVPGENLFLNADGKRGGGTRVWRIYPRIDDWETSVTFHILDNVIDEQVFRRHIEAAGKFIGIGRFRPARGGFYGRFTVESIDWKETEV